MSKLYVSDDDGLPEKVIDNMLEKGMILQVDHLVELSIPQTVVYQRML